MQRTQTASAIPTDYAGHRFRSRLEAKWAAFFDLCGWPWEYEPVDLNGYIPDFILCFPFAPLLVEVKPILYPAGFVEPWKRIMESQWAGEAMLVGARIFDETEGWDDVAVIGSLAERGESPAHGIPDWDRSGAVLQRCTKCLKTSLFHAEGTWRCRVTGCYDGDHYLNPFDYAQGRELFAEASRIVQYNAP